MAEYQEHKSALDDGLELLAKLRLKCAEYDKRLEDAKKIGDVEFQAVYNELKIDLDKITEENIRETNK